MKSRSDYDNQRDKKWSFTNLSQLLYLL